ncbi:LytTR family DNA-binding domain-containing protein, partial [Aquimarina sp. Aq78]
HTLQLNFKGISFYFLKFLPLFFIAYFFTSPFSVGIRFLYHYYVLQKKQVSYFESYFFLNKNLYLSYLLPIIVICTLLLTVAVLNAISKSKNAMSKEKFAIISLTVKSEIGQKIISSKVISSITREGRKYYVTSNSNKYLINKNLKTLEKELDQNFISINRSTIINLAFFKEYSFWENEKYIVRLIDDQEFNITRERLKALKNRVDFFHKTINA